MDMKTTQLIGAACAVLLLADTSAAAQRVRPRRVTRLPQDAVQLSQQVMARITTQLLAKDLKRVMALEVPRVAAPQRPVLQRDPLLDAPPLVRDTVLSGRIPIPGQTPIERASFVESFSGVGTFDNSTRTFTGTGVGSRSGFRPGDISGSLTGGILVQNPQQAMDFAASNPGASVGNFSATAQGDGFRMGDTFVSGNTRLAVSGVARGNLPGNVTIPLASPNFTINDAGASQGRFSNSISFPAISGGQPTVVGVTLNADYATQPR
jgi:hypothetical protein